MEKKEVKKKDVKKEAAATKLPLITRPRGGTTVDNRSLSRRFKNVKLQLWEQDHRDQVAWV